ncbi:MAG: DUF998 domain-containing protein [Chloroflexi bacterium]|nr:DUF998 domain-containing protein [Chloroflexota bacterium]
MILTVSRICGLAAPLAGVISLWLAISSAPWFSFTREDLSVLGVQGTAPGFFNWGVGVTGLLSIAFAIGLGNGLPGSPRLKKLGVVALIAGSAALALVGLIPRTYSAPHRYASGIFFTLVPFAIFAIGLSLLKIGQRLAGWSSVAAALAMVGIQLVPWPWEGGAIPQLLSGAPWCLWTAAMGIGLTLRE